MFIKIFLTWLSISLLTSGCGAAPTDGEEFDRSRAGDLITRNLLLGEDLYPVEDPRAFEYGTVHVDGPSGGLLYRFSSEPELLPWLIEQHGLQETMIETPDQLPLDFILDQPGWWDPWMANPSDYYVFTEEFTSGGSRTLILIFDSAAGVFYAVEYFADMPGV